MSGSDIKGLLKCPTKLATIYGNKKKIKQGSDVIKPCFKLIPKAKMDRNGKRLKEQSRSGSTKESYSGGRSRGIDALLKWLRFKDEVTL